MNQTTHFLILTILAGSWSSIATGKVPPKTDAPPPPPGSAHGPAQLDVELDPLAYVAQGYSVHAGLRYRRLRFDVGAFGLEVPEFVHGNNDFTSRFGGFGVKLDYRFKNAGDGFFVGANAGRVLQTVTHKETNISSSRWLHELSLRVGYEFSISNGFYVVPWVSVGHMFGSKEVLIAGDTFAKERPVAIFPTIHLGYRL